MKNFYDWSRTLLVIFTFILCVTIHHREIDRLSTPVIEVEAPEMVVVTETYLSCVEPDLVDEIELMKQIPVKEKEVVDSEPKPTESKVEYFDVPLDKELQDYIFAICEHYKVDPAIVVGMIGNESTYRAHIVGDSGRSFGLMQIQPKWHQKRMDKLGCPDLLNPYHNVTVGVDYLAELMGRGKSVEWALMAYNGGPSYANKKQAAGVVSSYVKHVMDIVEDLERS